MRDGTKLLTHLYIPENSKGPLPCILIRTPGPAKLKKIYSLMSDWGYVVAIQSLRSHHHSEQHPEPYIADAWGTLQDGHDAIEWLGNSSYTNGNVGTYGASANGITQLLLAPTQPKHLKCQFIQVATPTLYQHAAYVGGAFCKHQIESWFSKIAPKAYQSILENKSYNSYWEQIDASKKSEYVKTPAVHIGGWYDVFSQGTIDAFCSWQKKGAAGAKGKQKLIMGPWTHWGSDQEQFGEFKFPQAALEFEENQLIRDWFDAHLKAETEKLNRYPEVLYYVMGPLDETPSKGNQWKKSHSWPPAANKKIHYLSKSHRLKTKLPAFSSREYSFDYNPDNPVSTVGGKNLYLQSGPFDQSKNEKRDDVLTFTTLELNQDTEVTGRITATIYLSSSAPNTDLALTLTDVYPDGKSILISEGIQHVQLKENGVQAVDVDLWSTSMVFAKGHKIRLSVASSNFPHFDKNPNPADNVIHVGSKYPSQIVLPIIE
ncbi:MAG: Cocaine esterase [Chlamydiae bacterium]|nr:Cocaine esterase [Chlamydiota bacterium]